MTVPIKPETSKYTDSQWRAIYQEGCNILVSASAGSGKTTVLTQRIVEKLKRGVSIEDLVVVTYTQAAALEMKERLERVLKQEINREVDDEIKRHLQLQISLLPQAYISTIHAFCLKLIRQYFYLVHLDPTCRMMSDETEIALLKEEVWLNLKEQLYQEESFVALARAYANDKYDDALTELIFSLYTFAMSNEFPDQWLNHLPQLYQTETITESTLFEQLIKPNVIANIRESMSQMTYALHLVQQDEALKKAAQLLLHELEQLQTVQQKLAENKMYDEIVQAFQAVTFERWSGAGSKADSAVKAVSDKAKRIRETVKTSVKDLQMLFFNGTQERQLALLKLQEPFIQEMVRVVQLFAKRYEQAKRELNVVEFSDLEHLALEILAPTNQDGKRVASDISKLFQAQFNEVMIDEYQDVNRLQESILSYLTNGHNLFMVGDVKQSIYSFRLADPSLFLEKYLAYGQQQGGERIILAENFRSRGTVLEGTNFIFQQIMDEQVGDMAYDQHAMLIQGNRSFQQDENYPVSLLLYETEEDFGNEPLGDVDEQFRAGTTIEGEIGMVAREIKQLIAKQLPITEDGEQRPIQYKDIVLLVPTRKHNVVIQTIFDKYHIPIFINQADTYFQRTEVMIMMSLLKIIDNPYQDIPLVSVLRSPIVQLDENDLAAIRINKKTDDYYAAVLTFVANYEADKLSKNDFHDTIYDKLKHFLELLEKWRFTARQESLVFLIWMIYQDTHFLEYMSTLPSGKQRLANLHALYEHAKTYEKTQFKGLFQFVRFIEKMQEKDNDLAEISQLEDGQNTVQLMTIHGSKGLEFPVVFVMDMGKGFNKTELRKPYVFSEEYGIGSDYFDYESKWRYPTLAREGIKQHKEKKMLAEEMRKLYVALTRAKEKLYLVGSCKSAQSYWENLEMIQEHEEIILPAASRLKTTSLLGWISMAFVRHRCGDNDFLPTTTYPLALAQSPVRYDITFYTSETIQPEAINTVSRVAISEWLDGQMQEKDTGNISEIVSQMTYQYPYQVATRTTSYQSVSELKRMIEDPDNNKMEPFAHRFGLRYTVKDFKKPQFMEDTQQITGSMIGNAVHLFMQTIPLHDISLNTIEQHLQQLVSRQLIAPLVADKIDRHQLLAFFMSEFGQYLVAHAKQLEREVPFSLIVTANQLFFESQLAGEHVLVHGIVDGYVALDDGIVLYDFKTDYVTSETAENVLLERYTNQLSVYANALEVIMKKPVKEVYIVALSVNEVIPVKWRKWRQESVSD